MPTNDERREIAQKLREYASWEGSQCLVYCEHFGEMVLNLFIGKCGESFRANYEYLADLIEPEPERTCRNIEKDEYGYWHGFVCSECGEDYDESDDMSYSTKRIKYCPKCGAKVM